MFCSCFVLFSCGAGLQFALLLCIALRGGCNMVIACSYVRCRL